MPISIVIPTLNEETTIEDLADSLRRLDGDYEVIVVDGGSVDRTVEKARARGLRVVAAQRGRGQQMNAGAELAKGETLLFLHSDSRLPDNGLHLIEKTLEDRKICGGNFGLIFDGGTREARILTLIYPLLRIGGMCYGDSGFFVRRSVFEALGGYRNYPLFEDCDLYRRLRRVGRFKRLTACAVTSSRRFEGRFTRTFALWSALQVLYWLGVNPAYLDKLYKPIR